jgi:hypothetical protein
VNLRRFNTLGWMRAAGDVWAIPAYLTSIPHTLLLNPDLTRGLNHVEAH